MRRHISTGLEYIGKWPLSGICANSTPSFFNRRRYDNPEFSSPYINILGQCRLKNTPSKSSVSHNRTMDSKIGRTTPACTRARKVLAYNGLEKDFVSRVRTINSSRNASGLSDGKSKICRLRKQSYGARLPLMSMKLKTRSRCWWTRRRAVSPPIEWPMIWNLSILKCESTADAVATKKGISMA